MEAIPLSELTETIPLRERLRQYAETIPEDRAVPITEIKKDWGLQYNPGHIASLVPDLVVQRFHTSTGKKRWFLLNLKTARRVQKNG